MRSGGVAPCILNLGITQKTMNSIIASVKLNLILRQQWESMWTYARGGSWVI